MQHTAKQIEAARVRAAKLAAFLTPTANASEAEREAALSKLTKLCKQYGFTLADFVQPEAKPKQARADQRAKREATASARADELAKLREAARAFYNGASLAVHARRAAPIDVYAARVLEPVQRPANGIPSVRDESGLALILANVAGDGVSFDPVKLAFDVGIISRLSALSFIETDGAAFRLTKAGAERARIVIKRAA